jgi:hypothetical protein
MSKTHSILPTVLAACAAGLAAPSNAAIIVSLPGGTVVPIPAVNIQGSAGPIGFGPGITFTTTSPTALFGWTGPIAQYQAFPWLGNPAIALNNIESAYTLTFDTPVRAFLGQVTWGRSGYAGYATRMSAYDANGAQLDAVDFVINGQQQLSKGFYGFSYAGPDIKSIVFNNDFIAVRNISIMSAVPEPAAWAMMIIGFGLVGGSLRRQRATQRVQCE